MRTVIQIVGVLLLLMGLLWVGQGLGYIHWPTSSFMLGEASWAGRGWMLAALGLAMLVLPVFRRR